MKKPIYILSVIIFITLVSSCTSINKINVSYYETRQQNINKGAIPYSPVVADLKVDIDRKISGSASREVDIYNYNNSSIENTKQQALYNAMTNSGADIVIDPIYKINANNDGNDKKVIIQAEVTGFYGKYLNIHKADTTELKNIIKYGSQSTIHYNSPSVNQETTIVTAPTISPSNNKKKRKIIGWTIGTLLLAGLTIGLTIPFIGRSVY